MAERTPNLHLLAYEIDFEPLNQLTGAPLRLQIENQLGFKMVKWIQAIEFLENTKTISQGEGGYNEDREYFGELAKIGRSEPFDVRPGMVADAIMAADAMGRAWRKDGSPHRK